MPIGLKFFEDAGELQSVKKLRKFGHPATFCQVVTQARTAGWTIGVEAEDLLEGCASVFGLIVPPESRMDGSRTAGVWFHYQEDARKHQEAIPRIPHSQYQAIAVAPLSADKFEPDVAVIFGMPAQIILFVNGMQWEGYKRYQFHCVGETACSDSMVQCFNTGEPSLAIPCYGERRYGGVQDDEIVIAVKPDMLEKVVTGLKGLGAAGLRYPIPPYGSQSDPSAGMAKSYGEKK
jgi:uncharacterized protein (DUF169 family)